MILSLPTRLHLLSELVNELENQSNGLPVEILYFGDSKSFPIGQKRNMLKQFAQGDYSCWVDDDDWITSDYITEILNGIEYNTDVVCFSVKITQGKDMKLHPKVHGAYYSLKNSSYKNQPNFKYSKPCHVHPIKHSIVSQYDFDECSYCKADIGWTDRINKELKTEYIIDKQLYFNRRGISNDRAGAPKSGKKR